MLTEAEIKALVLNRLREEGRISKRSVITSEFPIFGTGVRADLAILDTDFLGIEIKGPRDSLRRLERQLGIYSAYFDHVVVVMAPRHYRKIGVPPGVEVWLVHPDQTIEICKLVEASAEQFEKPLQEILTATQRRKFSRTDGQPSQGENRQAFEQAFRERFLGTSREFWAKTYRRKIRADDLHHLRRFRGRDLELQRRSDYQNSILNEWLETTDQL